LFEILSKKGGERQLGLQHSLSAISANKKPHDLTASSEVKGTFLMGNIGSIENSSKYVETKNAAIPLGTAAFLG
jgi:hypothetical protein